MRYITPEIIIKEKLAGKPKPNWAAAVICFQSNLASRHLISPLQANRIEMNFLSCGESLIANLNGKAIVICIGAKADLIVEELAYLNVPYIIGIGAAGSIVDNFNINEIVIANRAIRTDGTSNVYGSGDLIINNILLDILFEAAIKNNIEIRTSVAGTVDAYYREYEDLLQEWRVQGVQIINCETSPFYAAADACQVEAIWIGHISDLLCNNEWIFATKARKESKIRVSNIVIDMLNRLTSHNCQKALKEGA